MRRTDRPRDGTERAQSEALGFTLIFAVVILIIGLVVTLGYANLVDARDHERVNNAERGFESLAANVEEVVRNDAPSRSTELAVADGRLVTRSETTMTIEWRESGSSNSTKRSFPLTALVYDGGTEGRVVYEAGAVIREDDSGSVLVRKPFMQVNNSTTIIPVARLYGTERVGVSGKESVLLRTERNRTSGTASTVLVADPGTTYTVSINVTSPRAKAWQQYLESRTGASCDRSGDTVTCNDIVVTDRLVVYVVDVDVSRAG